MLFYWSLRKMLRKYVSLGVPSLHENRPQQAAKLSVEIKNYPMTKDYEENIGKNICQASVSGSGTVKFSYEKVLHVESDVIWCLGFLFHAFVSRGKLAWIEYTRRGRRSFNGLFARLGKACLAHQKVNRKAAERPLNT
jgi:hypothetical protein